MIINWPSMPWRNKYQSPMWTRAFLALLRSKISFTPWSPHWSSFIPELLLPQRAVYHVWLSASCTFKNGKFCWKDLSDWITWEKRSGIHLPVAVLGNFPPTTVSRVFGAPHKELHNPNIFWSYISWSIWLEFYKAELNFRERSIPKQALNHSHLQFYFG